MTPPDFNRAKTACFSHLPQAEHLNLMRVVEHACVQARNVGFLLGLLIGAAVAAIVYFIRTP